MTAAAAPSDSTPHLAPAPQRPISPELLLTVITLALSALLLFTHLGTQALWDDEANTALVGLGVLRTGDTSAQVDDHNFVAYNGGCELIGLKQRYLPPGQAYIAAGSMALLGRNALGARFGFALFGLATVALLLRWMARDRAPFSWRVFFCVLLVSNVSLFLFFRNARYFAPATFFTVAAGFCYTAPRTKAWAALLGTSLLGLLACNYFLLIPAFATIVVDYLLFTRKSRPIPPGQIAIALAIPLIFGLPIVWIWNPLLFDDQYPDKRGPWLTTRLILAYKNLRDLDVVQIVSLPMLAVPLVLYRWVKNRWLLQAPLFFAVYFVVLILVSPEPAYLLPEGATRYAVPIIPLALAMTATALFAIWQLNRITAVVVALLLTISNLPYPCALARLGLTSSQYNFVGELLDPPLDPYAALAFWVNQNVHAGQSVYVIPNYALYPIMFHAPAPTYAWQFPVHAKPDTPPLPAIQTIGNGAPDVVICEGAWMSNLSAFEAYEAKNGHHYVPAEQVLCSPWALQRPEIYWHGFRFVPSHGPADAIYIVRRID
jgi:hypothetical protein